MWVKACPSSGCGLPVANLAEKSNISLLRVRFHKCAFPRFLISLEVKRQGKENISPGFQAFLVED